MNARGARHVRCVAPRPAERAGQSSWDGICVILGTAFIAISTARSVLMSLPQDIPAKSATRVRGRWRERSNEACGLPLAEAERRGGGSVGMRGREQGRGRRMRTSYGSEAGPSEIAHPPARVRPRGVGGSGFSKKWR